MGISLTDEKMCFCPCGYKMKTWHTQFHLHFMKKSSRDDYCDDGNFMHIDLMKHIEIIAKLNDVNGLLHRGVLHYVRFLYKDFNGGRGHKALFNMGDKNYKEIEAYEKRTMERFIKQLQQHHDNELKRRLESERIVKEMELELKEMGLQQLNKDKFDAIHDLSKNLHDMALAMKPKVNRSAKEYEAARSDIESIFKCLRGKCCMKRKQKVKIPSQFSLQQLLDRWYHHPDDDVLSLFQPIENANHLVEFLYEWNVEVEDKTGRMNVRKGLKAEDRGDTTAQFLSDVWLQVVDLAVQVKNEKYVKLFEPTKGGLLMVTEDQLKAAVNGMINNAVDAETLYAKVLLKAKAWYRAIGRIMIHSLIGKSEPNLQNRHFIPSFIVPRFYRNIIFRNCGPEGKNEYPWAEVVEDLRKIELGGTIDKWNDQKQDPEKIFTQLIPDNFIKGRQVFIDAFKEGVTIGGIFDSAGFMLKDIPVNLRKNFEFTSAQLGKLVTTQNKSRPPYFKSLDLDVLDTVIFTKGSVTAENITKILRVRFWEFPIKKNVMVHPEIVNSQRSLFEMIGSVIIDCSIDDEDFPSRFIEFFTGYAYLPVYEKSQSDGIYPQPDPYGKSK